MAPELLVTRFYEELWNRQAYDRAPELLSSDLAFRGSLGSKAAGIAGFLSYARDVHAALDGYRCTIRQLVPASASCAARVDFSGVHTGTFLGYPPTGKRLTWGGAAFFTIENELISEIWVLGDLHGLHAQLSESSPDADP